MKCNFFNFMCGSQFFGYFGFMFVVGFKGLLLVIFVVMVWFFYWEVILVFIDYQIYLVWMYFYVLGYVFMEFDFGKFVEFKLVGGGIVCLLFNVVCDFFLMCEVVVVFVIVIWCGVGFLVFVFVLVFIVFWWFVEWFGGKFKECKYECGVMFVNFDEFEVEIDWYNCMECVCEL